MVKTPVYLIFGAEGVLGRGLLARLGSEENKFRIFAFPHVLADVTQSSHIVPLLEYIKPSVVVNCAGVSDPDLCEDAKKGAFSINGEAPGIVANAAEKIGAKTVFFSTAGVFDGKTKKPAAEDAKIAPKSIHAQSKIVGEEAIRAATGNHLIMRLGWVLNYESPNWATSWVDSLESGKEVHAIKDITGSVSYVPDVMDAMVDLISADNSGTYNVSNSGTTSQYGMASLFAELMDADRKLVSPIGAATQKWWKAPIPKWAVMDSSKYEKDCGKTLRSWEDAIKHCLFTMGKYKPD